MTDSMTTQPEAGKVIIGVDTHKHVHVAVAIDTRGMRLGAHSFGADSGGYRALLAWALRMDGSRRLGSKAPVAMAPLWRGRSAGRGIGSRR